MAFFNEKVSLKASNCNHVGNFYPSLQDASSSSPLTMIWYQIFQDGPEYEFRKKKRTFTPPNFSIKEIREAVPGHLFEKSTSKSLFYVFRHLALTCAFYCVATQIKALSYIVVPDGATRATFSYIFARHILRGVLWILYWGWQGVTFAGIWCLGRFYFLFSMIVGAE